MIETLKEELSAFPIEPEWEDFIMTKDFYKKLHLLHYKYKRLISEVLSEDNEVKRLDLLRQKNTLQDLEGISHEALQEKHMKIQAQYETIINGEKS